MAAMFALCSVNIASAAFYVTGSTAFRNADVTAEVNYLLTNYPSSGGHTVTAAYWASSGPLTLASASIIYLDGTPYFVNGFTGSIAGTQTLISTPLSAVPTKYPSVATYASGTSYATVTAGTATTPASGGTIITAAETTDTSETSDIAFSDSALSTNLNIINQVTSSTPSNQGAVVDTPVGIVPFVFMASTGAPTDINVTPQNVSYLWGNGYAPLSVFTGNTSDYTTTLIAMGRDVDSGTRATFLAETGESLNGSGSANVLTPINQYYPYDNSADAHTANLNKTAAASLTGLIPNNSAGPIGAYALVPKETVDGYFMAQGDGGYNSGGKLATALGTTNSLTKTYFLTYLGIADAQTALQEAVAGNAPNAAVLCTYNGFKFDPNPSVANPATNAAVITSGAYTFWTTEHEFYLTSDANTVGGTSVSSIASSLKSILNGGIDELASNGVTQSAMQVARSNGDGTEIEATGSYLPTYTSY